jgi:uncharacterized protein YfdQ (DUF2303 family)
MKYRIQVTTHKDGRKTFNPQVKGLLFWRNMYNNGESSLIAPPHDYERQDTAMLIINRHRKLGVRSIDSIYINIKED